MNETSDEKVKIQRLNDTYLIWDARHAVKIRKEWKIVGKEIGASNTTVEKSLPLSLAVYQVKYLLVSYPHQVVVVDFKPAVASAGFDHKKAKGDFDKSLERFRKEQLASKLKGREKILDEKKDKIIAGLNKAKTKSRKRKLEEHGNCETLNSEFTEADFPAYKKQLLEKDKQRLIKNYEPKIKVHIKSQYGGVETTVPENELEMSELENIQYRVFTELYRQGKVVTSGLKFGGHFLAYPGDPLLYHSEFVVYCDSPGETWDKYRLASHGRVATNARKTFIIASIDENTDQVVFEPIIRNYENS